MSINLRIGDVVCLAEELPRTVEGNFVMYDDPARGGDGTYFASGEEFPWSLSQARASVMQSHELCDALAECDNACVLRDRLVARKVEVTAS